MIISLIAAAALFGAGDPDEIIPTAPVGSRAVPAEAAPTFTDASPADAVQQTPHGLTTDQQIDRWVGAREAGVAPFGDGALTELPDYERRMHGQVSASVGTDGYRGYSASVDLPLGESGWISLNVAQSENGYGYPYESGLQPYGGVGYPGGVSGARRTMTSTVRDGH